MHQISLFHSQEDHVFYFSLDLTFLMAYELNYVAQFIAVCSNLKWSNNLTNSPLFALLAIFGSNAACKITSDCWKALRLRKLRKN